MIAVIDVTGNNLSSLTNAIHHLGFKSILTHSADEIQKASHVILPGVGSAAPAMQALQQYGLIDILRQIKQPILGICLGMQLLYEHSEEGEVDCLGLIPGVIKKLPIAESCPVPHMGWNSLQWVKTLALQQGVPDNEYFYFVHSYAALSDEYALARCQYSETFTAIVQKDNAYGMQFHPEKSADAGLQLLNNFLKREASC